MKNKTMVQEKIVFRTGIDWWIVICLILALALIWIAAIGMNWLFTVIYGGGITLLLAVMVFGCWYEIKGDELIVYQFFRPHIFPIDKIKEVKKTVGCLATAGLSRKRVSIIFEDRSVMKSTQPLEVSPKDRNAFIARLKQVNPDIIAMARKVD